MDLRRTPLFDRHQRHGGRLVAFAGWELPVQFEGVMAEHRAVRTAAGLFDVSHMARFEVAGSGAESFLDGLLTNDVTRLEPGALFYTALCEEDGGTIDDLVVARFADRFLVVANASNHDPVWAWFQSHATGDVHLTDRSAELAHLALQGPKSQPILEKVLDHDLEDVGYYRFVEVPWSGQTLLVSRNGYTGEDGFEIYPRAENAGSMWDALFEAGGERLSPVGLGARDTLRLEVAYPLYGHELGRSTTPVEAGLGWVVKTKGRSFVGHERLRSQKKGDLERKLVGLVYDGGMIARQGATLRRDDHEVGGVTSGTFGPSVGRGIGMALVKVDATEPGTRLSADVRGREVLAQVVDLPFYTDGTHR
jgi:aminomethyltransferase